MKKIQYIYRALFLLFALAVVAPEASWAQQGAAVAENAQPQTTQSEGESDLPKVAAFDADKYNSVLFTFWEHTAIDDARRSRGSVRAPTESELTKGLKDNKEEIERVKPPPEERDIRLGGIVYNSKNDWTIWLNNKRVTPNAIPEEVIDLRVFSEYIEVKWYDIYTNQIFPIRLKANTRFNIDTRIFLPG